MTREEILALLAEELPKLLKPTTDLLMKDVVDFMRENVEPIEESIKELKTTSKEKAKDVSKDEPQDTDPLSARVKLLEAQIEQANKDKAAQEAASQDLRFSQTLSGELDKVNPLHKGVVTELLANRFRKDAVEKDGQWLSKDGKNLTEKVAEFFSTPEGSHFMPSNHVNGVGATETSSPRTGDKIDIEGALLAAYG